MRSRRYAKLGCLLVWGLGLLLSVPTLYYRELKYEHECTSCFLDYGNDDTRLVFEALMITFSFIIPISIISFCTVMIINALRNRFLEQLNSQTIDHKATNLMLTVLLAFLICWLPFHLLRMAEILWRAEILTLDDQSFSIGSHIVIYLAFFSSVLNPILYVIVGKNFQMKVKELFKQQRRKMSLNMTSVRSNLTRSTKNERRMLSLQDYEGLGIPANFTEAIYGAQNDTTNCPPEKQPGWIITAVPVYILVISVLGIVFNVFVLMVFCLHKKPCTVPEIYLSNLAATDLMLMACLPFWAVNVSKNYNWIFGWFMCKIVNTGIRMNVYCSIYFLTLISIDRYLAVVHTMSLNRMRSRKYATLGCLLVWGLGLLLSVPTLYYRGLKYQHECTSCILKYGSRHTRLVFSVILILPFIIPLFIISYCSVKIIKALNNRSLGELNGRRTDHKATKLVLAVLLAFLIFLLPFHLLRMAETLWSAGILTLDIQSFIIGSHIVIYLAFFNSVLNPILYVFVGKNFWKTLRDNCRQRCS
ncbi:B2 bradykinin receptor [Nibea albiflora]|uniref:B2 bradykinin receptor n=1 Tax=Nibea albiflora TaxID=240163 RepID=A0ACB7FFH9_NIBAL|nr:B2 bradykinin receptor [Nibea albiflora]